MGREEGCNSIDRHRKQRNRRRFGNTILEGEGLSRERGRFLFIDLEMGVLGTKKERMGSTNCICGDTLFWL